MKKKFQVPEVEVITFSVEDIITTSNFGDTDWDNDMDTVTKITGVE